MVCPLRFAAASCSLFALQLVHCSRGHLRTSSPRSLGHACRHQTVAECLGPRRGSIVSEPFRRVSETTQRHASRVESRGCQMARMARSADPNRAKTKVTKRRSRGHDERPVQLTEIECAAGDAHAIWRPAGWSAKLPGLARSWRSSRSCRSSAGRSRSSGGSRSAQQVRAGRTVAGVWWRCWHARR